MPLDHQSFLFYVQLLQVKQQMHAAEIVQSEVNVHNLVLILIDLFGVTRA